MPPARRAVHRSTAGAGQEACADGARGESSGRDPASPGPVRAASAPSAGALARPGLPRPGAGVTRLPGRLRGLVRELGKFGTVGAVAFTVDLVLFAWLNARLEPLLAKTAATVVSASVAFLGNRFWTWRHRARSGLGREYVLYFLLNVVGLLIALAVLAASHYGLGTWWPHLFRTPVADIVAANFVGTAAGTLFRFWSYRRFVFLAHDSRSSGATPPIVVERSDPPPTAHADGQAGGSTPVR